MARPAAEGVQAAMAWVFIVGGLMHTAATAISFPAASAAAAGFLGSGLALVYLGLLNLVALGRPFARWPVHSANASALVFALFVLSQLPRAPQSYAMVLGAVVLFVAGLVNPGSGEPASSGSAGSPA